MKKLKVLSVQRHAWNCEKVLLSSSEADVTLDIKDPGLHGEFQTGDEVSISLKAKAKNQDEELPKVDY